MLKQLDGLQKLTLNHGGYDQLLEVSVESLPASLIILEGRLLNTLVRPSMLVVGCHHHQMTTAAVVLEMFNITANAHYYRSWTCAAALSAILTALRVKSCSSSPSLAAVGQVIGWQQQQLGQTYRRCYGSMMATWPPRIVVQVAPAA